MAMPQQANTPLVVIPTYNEAGTLRAIVAAIHDALPEASIRFARTLLRLPVRDCTAGFKCYRRCVLEALDLEAIHLEGYAFQIAMVYQSYRHGFRIQEVPIVFRDRTAGTSKMNTAIVAEAVTYVLGQRGVAAQEWGRAHRARRGDGRAAAPRGPVGPADRVLDGSCPAVND
jgi:hypothetical protein